MKPITPRSISCPSCHTPAGEVCMTYVDPDAADDLAQRVPLYCAARIDAAFIALARSFQGEDSPR